jgi:hypothetical protein
VKDNDTLRVDLKQGGPVIGHLHLGEKKSYLQALRGIWLGVPVGVEVGEPGSKRIGVQGRIGGTKDFNSRFHLLLSSHHMVSILHILLLPPPINNTCFNFLSRCRIIRSTIPDLSKTSIRDSDQGHRQCRDRGRLRMGRRKLRKRRGVSECR